MVEFDLGTYHRAITTTSPEAQAWCDQGLMWAYGFVHEESMRCYQRAAELDPDCVTAHWGIAYAVGPNYNVAWDAFTDQELTDVGAATHASVQRALAATHGSDTERELAYALTARFPSPEMTDDLQARSIAYADAMAEVHQRHPDDLDVAALYADALLNVTPWQLWDRWTGEPAEGSRALEARRVLEAALTQPGGAEHPGVIHLYIHLMEMSREPQTALPVADRLRTLVPDAGHLVHMPTHLDVLCGDYLRVVEWNRRAAIADTKYVTHARHALGALLLEQGRVEEAEAVYRADLGLDDTLPRVCHHPNNIWSLHGYHECLIRLGKAELATVIGQQLTLAKAYADVNAESSCFCRLETHHEHADHCCG